MHLVTAPKNPRGPQALLGLSPPMCEPLCSGFLWALSVDAGFSNGQALSLTTCMPSRLHLCVLAKGTAAVHSKTSCCHYVAVLLRR